MRIFICVFVLLFSSCGAANYSDYEAMASGDNDQFEHSQLLQQEQHNAAKIDADNTKPSDKTANASRRIVFEADIDLIVDDFAPAEQRLRSLVTSFDGYMSNVEVNRIPQYNSQRRGTWTARVPVNNFEVFLDAVRELGNTACITQDARDVTMEYVDLGSRIANKKKLEVRISELLGNSREDIQDLIKIEHELANIREQIEVMEGRLRKLKDLSAITTVSITMIERKPEPVIVVAAPPVPPTFSQRVDEAWTTSMSSAREIFENLAVWLAGNLIAIAGYFFLAILAIWFIRIAYKYIWLPSQHVRA